MSRLITLLVWLLCLTTGALGIAACSGDDSGGSTQPDPTEQLADAKAALDSADSLTFSLSTDGLPSGQPGVLDASGVGTHEPAFRGDIEVNQSGLGVNGEVVAVGGKVYAKLLVPVFVEIDPADYGAPDPAVLMSEKSGISSLLTAAQDVKPDGQRREGDDVLDQISGTIPGDAMAAIFPSADGSAPFPVTFALAGDGKLRSAEISGPFYGGDSVTYTVTLDEYGGPVEITAP
jgi:lipoprotein LprG